jgi:uncharacterized membrane protein
MIDDAVRLGNLPQGLAFVPFLAARRLVRGLPLAAHPRRLLQPVAGGRLAAVAALLTRQRTFEQDPKYALRLLVDIAIKALSPAINDPTTAVQAVDQIEDLMRRLGRHDLEAGYVTDANGILRVVFPMPSWEDYLRLSFDEIRQFGTNSVQVMRRLRSALSAVAEAVTGETRTATIEAYLKQLDQGILRSALDAEDRLIASQEDRQGLGLSRKRAA